MQCLLQMPMMNREDIPIMRTEVTLTAEQEKKLALIHDRQGLTCTDQELVQSLFNEALTANYLIFNNMKKSKQNDNIHSCADIAL